MPCGVTKTLTSNQVLVCDNPGTSTHAGQHSASMVFYGLTVRSYWSHTADKAVAAYKRPLIGVRARDDQGWIDVPTPAVLTAAGMDLSIPHECTDTFTRPNGWVVRGGFDSTEIEDSAMVMSGPGSVRVTYRAGHDSGGFGYTVAKRLLKNGAEIHTSATVDTAHTVDVSVATGDRIWAEFRRTGGFGGGSTIIRAGAGETFLFAQVL